MVRFRKMTTEGFEIYKSKLIQSYAESIAKNMKRTLEATLVLSEQQISGLLKDGVDTKDHYIYDVVALASGETVGVLWVNDRPEDNRAFIFDIEIDAKHQGKGYGKATLAELEVLMKDMKVKTIGLNVFADNTTAFKLYEKSGYIVTNMNMQKEL
jgi:ribosomal protein S18 acetylase RimI-like enzyme